MRCQKQKTVGILCLLASHIAAVHRMQRSGLKQSTLSSVSTPETDSSTFNADLCEALLAVNIPLFKLNDPKFKSFLEKYTGKRILDESTMRKNYVSPLAEEVIDDIRNRVGDQYAYIMVDETTDARGSLIVNLLLGILRPETAGEPYLIASSEVDRANASTICTFINDSLVRFYKGTCFSQIILLFISDAAPYMVLAGKNLRQFCPRAIHVTCVAHAIHRICEKVRDTFPDVNRLISSSRKIFLKAPSRVALYKAKMSCPLPPEVVVTRWGTWMRAAIFFANHFVDYRDLINELPDTCQQLIKLREVIEKDTLSSDLAFIKTHLANLPDAIHNLEKRGLTLHAQMKIIDDIRQKMSIIPGARGKILKKKTEDVFRKNPGLEFMEAIDAAITDGIMDASVPRDPLVMSSYAYAPIVSVDVERSFSEYKYVLNDRRHNFTQSNLEKHLLVLHNKKFL